MAHATRDEAIHLQEKAMRYMMFLKHPRDYGDDQPPPELYEAMGAFIQEHARSGAFIDGGGYALIEARTHADAVAMATRFMELDRTHWPQFEGESEIRPLEGAA